MLYTRPFFSHVQVNVLLSSLVSLITLPTPPSHLRHALWHCGWVFGLASYPCWGSTHAWGISLLGPGHFGYFWCPLHLDPHVRDRPALLPFICGAPTFRAVWYPLHLDPHVGDALHHAPFTYGALTSRQFGDHFYFWGDNAWWTLITTLHPGPQSPQTYHPPLHLNCFVPFLRQRETERVRETERERE